MWKETEHRQANFQSVCETSKEEEEEEEETWEQDYREAGLDIVPPSAAVKQGAE